MRVINHIVSNQTAQKYCPLTTFHTHNHFPLSITFHVFSRITNVPLISFFSITIYMYQYSWEDFSIPQFKECMKDHNLSICGYGNSGLRTLLIMKERHFPVAFLLSLSLSTYFFASLFFFGK